MKVKDLPLLPEFCWPRAALRCEACGGLQSAEQRDYRGLGRSPNEELCCACGSAALKVEWLGAPAERCPVKRRTAA